MSPDVVIITRAELNALLRKEFERGVADGSAGAELEARTRGAAVPQDIAERLVSVYDLRPFILGDGHLGIHFMNLSWSIPFDETLIDQVREEIDAGREDFQEWRDTLTAAIAVVDAAIGRL